MTKNHDLLMLVVSLMAASLFLAPEPTRAADFEAEHFKTKIVDSRYSAVEIVTATLKKHSTIDGTLLYQLTARVINTSRGPLASVPIEYEILSAEGHAIGGGIIGVNSTLESLEESDLEVNTSFGGITIAPDDQVVFRPSYLTATQGLLKSEPDTCQAFCERCGEISAMLCSNGIQNFSCTCEENSRNCSFSCFPPV